MIEFKAECGHTVRTRDEDAGGVVRCTYCGRTAAVPEARDSSLDFLLDEVNERADAAAQTVTRRRRGWGWGLMRRRGRRRVGAFNPFPIIIRLCYAAFLICILVFVVKEFVIPLFTEQPPPQREAETRKRVRPNQPSRDARARPAAMDKGLLSRADPIGLFVASTPPGAWVYCVRAKDAPPEGRINRLDGCTSFRTPGRAPRLADGTYVVELALPWNDPSLTRYRGYTGFRRQIERAKEKERRRLVQDYFIPDEASAVFIDETEDQKYIVRQYRNEVLRDGRSRGVRALFLPKLLTEAENQFSIKDLVGDYIPDKKAYGFDQDYVRSELDYYGVPASDQPWILEALARIGVIPYLTDERGTLVFKIGIEDGVFAARLLRE